MLEWLKSGTTAAVLMCAGGAFAQDENPANKVPDFSGYFSQNSSVYLPPATGGVGPVMDHPQHPHVVIANGITSPWVGDYTNPNLKPWVAAEVKKNGDTELGGGAYLVAYQLCYPLGVPLILTQRENMQLLQEKDVITIIFQRDQQVRRIYLNKPHSANLAPSWYGESVGHYEGDTLVVDTTGLNTKTVVDRYGSPHTDALHVVERYHLTDAGRTLQVDFTVTDPGAFNAPWNGTQKFRRTRGPMEEILCTENNRNVQTGQEYPIPTARSRDF